MRIYLILLLCSLAAHTVSAQERPLRGRTVLSVVDELRAAGAPLVYSSALLPPTLTVVGEPAASMPLELAREILAPHGLSVREEGGVWLVVRTAAPAAPLPARLVATVQSAYAGVPLSGATIQLDPPSGPTAVTVDGRGEITEIAPGRHTVVVRAPGFLPERRTLNFDSAAAETLPVALFEVVTALDEITVTASRYDVRSSSPPSRTYFSRDQIETLAGLGDDTVRITQRLPGVASNEFSARPYVRGGAANEFTVLLDGVPLAEPYHLRDYQAVFSAIDERIVDAVEIYAGGFPVQYGGALSGVMVIDPREPDELAHEVGLSVLHTSVLTSGRFPGDRGSWVVSARSSNLDRVLADDLGQPAYQDLFSRFRLELGARHNVTFGTLAFRDDVLLTPKDSDGQREEAVADAHSEQGWLRFDSNWSDSLESTVWLYSTDFSSSRHERVSDLNEIVGVVDDVRELEVLGLKSAWRYSVTDRQSLSFGLVIEEHDAAFDYSSMVERRGLLATLGGTAPEQRAVDLSPSGSSYGAYMADRVRLGERLYAELGVRFDRQNYLPTGSREQFSPRGSLLYRVGERTDLRISHGRFFQPERLLDLQVEDGITEYARAQRAAHTIVSIERRLPRTLALRVEAYRKHTRRARPRYENLFDPLVLLPELRASRVRIAPERAEATGLEFLLTAEAPITWWAGLSLARVEDEIDGVAVPRSWDQQRALSAGGTWELDGWTLSAAASVSRGWPVTEVTVVELPTGERAAVAGERNVARLPSVRRLDLRASKDFPVGTNSLRFFIELINATDRRNVCCLAYEQILAPSGEPDLLRRQRERAGVTGNIGLLWQF